MNLPSISIIIPIYNSEGYLQRCIESARNQSYDNIEILLIDDGSTDRSGIICEEFAAKDNRIRVFHQTNSGVSAARNLGIKNAIGSWIAFIDSDDFIGEDFTKIVETLPKDESIELIQIGYTIDLFGKGKKVFNPHKSGIIEKETLFTNMGFSSMCWSYFYKREFIERISIEFNENVHYSEDREFVIKALLSAKSIYFSDSIQYTYLLNDTSAVQKKREYNVCKDDLTVLKNILSFIGKIFPPVPDKIKCYVSSKLLNSFITVIGEKLSEKVNYKIVKNDFNSLYYELKGLHFSNEDKRRFTLFSSSPMLGILYMKGYSHLWKIYKKVR